MHVPEEQQPGYISLKEASVRFGYSQDYLGQLIRKGKLEGKLVYSHVAWVTTPEAVEAYLKRGKKKHIDAENRTEETKGPLAEVAESKEYIDEDEHTSALTKWMIRIFRVLLFIVILIAIFVFYLITTAFGEELHSGTLVARASVIISDHANLYD